MIRLSISIPFALLIAMSAIGLPGGAAGPVAGEAKTDPCFKNLSYGCYLAGSSDMSREHAAAVGKKLGGAISKISKNTLVLHGKRIELFFVDARTEGDAVRIAKKLSELKQDPAFCLRRGKRVIEFVGVDATLARKASFELGFVKKPRRILYRLEAEVVPLVKADYMKLTKVLTLFLRAADGEPDRKTLRDIEKATANFEFGKSLRLREPLLDRKEAGFRFDPKPIAVDGPDRTGTTLFTFEKFPVRHGIPYVAVTAEIVVNDTGLFRTARDDMEPLLSPTAFWPVTDPEIVALAKEITAKKTSTEGKVRAILEWLTPGKNIRYGGGVTGSRWGVTTVLRKKTGRCWDFTDLFVTLARASGIACRQVGGWFYGVGGHVWAEVFLPGKGWQQVDATGGGKLGCGIYHIPYFTTEDGEMPTLIISLPRIEIVETD